jgi:hypothetical protein
MTTTDTLPTLEQAINETGQTFYGLTVTALGPDAETLLAYGHHDDPRRILAAFLAAARLVGYDPGAVEPGEIRRAWAIVCAPDPANGEEADLPWIADWSGDQDTPGAVPVTVLELLP